MYAEELAAMVPLTINKCGCTLSLPSPKIFTEPLELQNTPIITHVLADIQHTGTCLYRLYKNGVLSVVPFQQFYLEEAKARKRRERRSGER